MYQTAVNFPCLHYLEQPNPLISSMACCRLGLAMHAARDGTGEVQHLLSSTTFNPRLPGSRSGFFGLYVLLMYLTSTPANAPVYAACVPRMLPFLLQCPKARSTESTAHRNVQPLICSAMTGQRMSWHMAHTCQGPICQQIHPPYPSLGRLAVPALRCHAAVMCADVAHTL
jgi:hypothetical protein